jgi:hypothetical protein
MRRALLAVGSEPGHTNKSSASRIRRRSRQHLAEASELDGPMKDRLWRWHTPVVIDRIRRGAHDRADATGPCRGCATAASCRAAIVDRPMAACNICVGCNLDRIAGGADGTARTRHWGVAEFQVAGGRCRRAEQAHHMRTARRVPRLACSPAGANRPAEAALCLESRARNSWARADHPEYEGFGDSFRRAQQADADARPMPACGGSFAL